ncbi:hypothetical protein BDV11DRAFT_202207 [Aspergillus similis]
MSESWDFYSKALRAMLGLRTLPTGYKAVIIEGKNHFNHLYVFPGFGVVPATSISRSSPTTAFPASALGESSTTCGLCEQPHADAGAACVRKSIGYEYLAFATGTWQSPPFKPSSTEKAEACTELQASQKRIQHANHIAVVGGGPVGTQIATDIASYFSETKVTLVHSPAQLLPIFGPRLHEHVYKTMKKQLNIDVNGQTVKYDLIPCTGQRPNSGLLEKFILVRPTLQIADPINPNPRIFALGDVARKNGPRMARAARAQADVVASNILFMIHQGEASTSYAPQIYESVIKLTLGKIKEYLEGFYHWGNTLSFSALGVEGGMEVK